MIVTKFVTKAVRMRKFLLALTMLSSSTAMSIDYQTFIETIAKIQEGKTAERSLVMDFAEVAQPQTVDWKESADKIYPHGDFYYLIGDLSDQWSERDFNKFYSVAKWLAKKGFRVIINPIAFIGDVREAVQNPRTSALIWNSHGNSSGKIFDTNKKALPADIFTTDRSPKLNYILFANCYGTETREYYKIDKDHGFAHAFGFRGTATSTDLFKYLFGTDFNDDLANSLEIKLSNKTQDDI